MEESIHRFAIDSNTLFQSLANNTNDYIYIWDFLSGSYTISDNMARDFAIDKKGKDFLSMWNTFIYKRDLERVKTNFEQQLWEHKTRIHVEYQVVNAKGIYIWLSDKADVFYNKIGEPELVIGIMHNVMFDGNVDNITGLLMHDKCKELYEINQMNRSQNYGSLLLLGIDDFMSINTMNNHSFGDLVLRTIALDILNMLPDGMSMYRFDGDQFLIFGDQKTTDEMQAFYRKIKAYTTFVHRLNDTVYHFSISGGIASFPENGFTWGDIQKAVSIALKEAKDNGKNQCVQVTKKMLQDKLQEQSLSFFLADSVQQGCKGFRVVFQPVCRMQKLTIKGAEILLRFETGEGELVNPDRFIPLLEQSQLILPVGLWVLEEAIKACKKWVSYIDDFVMNVNVSYLQLHDLSFCDHVERLLEKYDLDVKHITLELTESYFITDAPNINISMKRLEELHLQVAIDDFGTGYSSLSRLSQFNVDVVKIDRSFVQSIHKSKYNHDFIDSVVRLCHNVGMKVCVEGVETKEEQMSICLLDVDYIQGFYVSRPVSEDVFFHSFILNPNVNDTLVVEPNAQLLHLNFVKDKNVLMEMMDACPLALNFWSRNLEIIACNEEVLRLFDAKDFDDFKENFFQFSPIYQPDGRKSEEKAKTILQEVFTSEKATMFWEHCTRQGERIPAEATLVRLPYMNDYIIASYTRDMREEMRVQDLQQNINERISAVLDSMPLICLLWSLDMKIIDCNDIAVHTFHTQSKAEIIQDFDRIMPEKQPDGSLSSEKKKEKFREVIEKGFCIFEWMYQSFKGERIPCEVTLVKINLSQDEIIVAYSRDLRELHQTLELNERLSRIAYNDVLTGCASRIKFMEQFEEYFYQNVPSLAFIIFDIDYFKKVNDSYGHAAGDAVLKRVAKSIQRILPDHGLLGRFGGDEFMILMNDVDRQQLQALMNECVQCIQDLSFYHEDQMFKATISMGASFLSRRDQRYQQVIKRADKALYKAKNMGRNCAIIL